MSRAVMGRYAQLGQSADLEAIDPTNTASRTSAADAAAGRGSDDRLGTAGAETTTPRAPGDRSIRTGGTLRIPGRQPTTLDPALARDVTSAEYLYEIYSGLVTITPELEIEGDLASGWEVSDDGRVYTFTLHADAVFHDGRPVKADDVTYSIERACDPRLGSTVAATYLGDIVGCLDKLAGRASSVSGARAVDDSTVVLTIDAPKTYFLSKLTYPTAFVVDREQTSPAMSGPPNGSGPFVLVENTPDQRIVLEANRSYYGSGPLLDRVVFDLRPVMAGTLYENGELDATPVGGADLARVTDPLNPLSAELVEGPGDLSLSYLAFNTRRPPYDDENLRRAIHQAIDRQWLTGTVLGGAVRPLGTILPPGMPGHDPSRGLPYDPSAARALLARSAVTGTDNIPPLVLTTAGDGGDNGVANAVADAISETLGLRVIIEQSPWEQFQQEMTSGEYGMWLLGWSADYADPQDFLDVLFHSEAPLNASGYGDPRVDAWLEEARTAADGEARHDLYARAESAILESSPWIPLYTGRSVWLVKPNVHGFTVPALTTPRLARVWMD